MVWKISKNSMLQRADYAGSKELRIRELRRPTLFG